MYIVWGDCGKQNAQHLERLQNQAMRVILGDNRKTCTQYMRSKLRLLSLSSRRCFMRLQLVYKIINNRHCPRQLERYLILSYTIVPLDRHATHGDFEPK